MKTLIHWFNPILWYAYHKMREDQEMACDVLALTYIHLNKAKEYGKIIIILLENLSGQKSILGTVNLSGTKKQLRERIIMIKLFKEKSYKWSLLGLGTALVLGGLCLTYAKIAATSSPSNTVTDKKVSWKGGQIGGEEVDGMYFINGSVSVNPHHQAIWNQLQQQEVQKNPRISTINVVNRESKQTRCIQTNRFSPCFYVGNDGHSVVKATIYKNNTIVKQYTLLPGQLINTNPESGSGRYILKIDCIGVRKGTCTAKGAVTPGDVFPQ